MSKPRNRAARERGMCAILPDHAGFFLAVRSGKENHELWDDHGTDLAGYDEYGMWWGTELTLWVLHPCADRHCPHVAQVVIVNGWCGSNEYTGYFFGTVEQASYYCSCRSVKVGLIEVYSLDAYRATLNH